MIIMIENNSARAGINADAIFVIVGRTLACAGGLMLAHSPRVQSIVTHVAQHPRVKEMGHAVVTNVVRGIGDSLSQWAAGVGTRSLG